MIRKDHRVRPKWLTQHGLVMMSIQNANRISVGKYRIAVLCMVYNIIYNTHICV